MLVVSAIATILYYALLIFFLLMWARFFLELARNFARNWRPRGFGLVLAEVVFSVTDPPVRAVRRVLPPLRLGGIALDFGFSVVMIAVIILMAIVGGFR